MIQRKTDSPSSSKYEAEADRMGDLAARRHGVSRPKLATGVGRALPNLTRPSFGTQLQTDEVDSASKVAPQPEDDKVAAENDGTVVDASADVEELQRVPGSSLPQAIRGEMESLFQTQLGGVRVHSGGASDRLNRRLGARALTEGKNIHFRANEFQPNTKEGRRLLGHELTHVMQQHGGNGSSPSVESKKEGGFRPSISGVNDSSLLMQPKLRVDVQLANGKNAVRVMNGKTKSAEYQASAGPVTVDLKKQKPNHAIDFKRTPPTLKAGKWGLQYFATINHTRGIGFHSNVAFPLKKGKDGITRRVEQRLIVDGTLRSHGCVRLEHANAKRFYDQVNLGTPVHLMDHFSSSATSADKSRKGTRTYVVVAGDNLSTIAKRFSVSEAAIMRANPGKVRGKKKLIRIGATLIIPASGKE